MMKHVPRSIHCSSIWLTGLLTSLALCHVSAIEITTVPTDLNPGDEYRLVFITDGKMAATSSLVSDYNSLAASEAASIPELLSLGIGWSAVASTAADDARDNTSTDPASDGAGVPVYGLDGVRIASGNSDLWDGALENAGIFVTQSGVEYGSAVTELVWTGTETNGVAKTTAGDTPLGGNSPAFGFSGYADSAWVVNINLQHVQATELARLYAISEPLVVPPGAPTLEEWKVTHGVTDLSADDDFDCYAAIVEYGLLTDPGALDQPEMEITIVEEVSDKFVQFTYLRHSGGTAGGVADPFDYKFGGVFYRAEVSDSPAGVWNSGPSSLVETDSETIAGMNRERVTVRVVNPIQGNQRQFVRVTVGELP